MQFLHMHNCSHVLFSHPHIRMLNVMIVFILGLAFIERPSSLSATSDLRYKQCPWEAPCGLTETIELVCLLTFTLDLATKVHFDCVNSEH